MDTADRFCYVFDEVNGNLQAEPFAWIQYTHFKKYIQENLHTKTQCDSLECLFPSCQRTEHYYHPEISHKRAHSDGS